MERSCTNIYFADYLDFSVENNGRNVDSPFEQLAFDLLCFYPASTAVTLTSTLIGDSTIRFVEFHDFWKDGKLKIHLSKGDTADQYLSRKLASSSGFESDNYEIKLYSSDGASEFVNKYLKGNLLANGIDYVLPRVSNADSNNRQAVLNNLVRNERTIIESPYFPMTMRDFDRLALRLENLADDSSFIFQRSHIIHDLIEHKIFKNASSIPNVLLSMFDESYNQAMAQSINATIISTMNRQLNGAGLRNFIRGYSPGLYNLIRTMTPMQICLLAQDKNWQIFRNYICALFESMSSNRLVAQNTDFYKETLRRETKHVLINNCLDKIADLAYNALKHASPGAYSDIQQAKMLVFNYINLCERKYSKVEEYYSEEIIKRTKLIEQICSDISNQIYT